ncbi:MAG TPA: hypothetical protein VHG69_11785 [Thermoleophilaceae bacterium]|nr:hypothetical protein [Thermoleophilaceae bacterium]
MHGRLSWQGLIAEQLERDPLLVERRQVLRRTLRGLSGSQLEALGTGLERHGHELVAGRLFKSAGGGGCAVGVMLRELDAVPKSSAPRFWLRDRWRRSATSYPAIRREPRLRHLEWGFDAVVERLRMAGAKRDEAVSAAGRWLLQLARQELAWRAQTAPAAFTSPSGRGVQSLR